MYITHNVDTRVVKSKTVWMSPSIIVLQNNLTARNKAVSSWVFNERPEQGNKTWLLKLPIHCVMYTPIGASFLSFFFQSNGIDTLIGYSNLIGWTQQIKSFVFVTFETLHNFKKCNGKRILSLIKTIFMLLLRVTWQKRKKQEHNMK